MHVGSWTLPWLLLHVSWRTKSWKAMRTSTVALRSTKSACPYAGGGGGCGGSRSAWCQAGHPMAAMPTIQMWRWSTRHARREP
jgi:hypothetical protein